MELPISESWLMDLRIGEGAWKNMQSIIREAFLKCFSQMKEQARQLESLNKFANLAKAQLAERSDDNWIGL